MTTGRAFAKWGLGLFLFGMFLSLGIIAHYCVGSRWPTGELFLKNITLWWACPWTLSVAAVQAGGLGMVALGVTRLVATRLSTDNAAGETGGVSLALCVVGLLGVFAIGYPGYFVFDAIWPAFFYAPVAVGKDAWLIGQALFIAIYLVGAAMMFAGVRRTLNTATARLAILVSLSPLGIGSSLAQESAQNDANNPLTPKLTLNTHDYYDPSLIGLPGRDANQFLLRGLIPAELFGVPQLLRYTMPIASAPLLPSGGVTGLGDLTLQDIFVIPGKPVSFGFGPLVVLPTATSRATGAGKWQAGPLALAIAPQSWGMIGALGTYQHSFAGQGGRPDTSLLTAQPLIFYNLPNGYYLRSSGIWNFDFENNTRFIPIGAGVGKVWEVGEGVTMNTFAEPQYTVWHHGNGMPRWQIFAGINFQIPLHKHR